MALPRSRLQRFLATGINSGCNKCQNPPTEATSSLPPLPKLTADAPRLHSTRRLSSRAFPWFAGGPRPCKARARRWRTILVIRSDGLDGFSFAAVFDGHAGFSSVKFLRDELYKECVAALDGSSLLKGDDFGIIRVILKEAFENADRKFLHWLGTSVEEDESGSTATIVFIGNNLLYVSHVCD